jgi:DNA-directed RNA polymerase specialized sigma24 family protein
VTNSFARTRSLHRVRSAQAALDAATSARAATIIAAHADGCSITDIADAAGLSRPTIYRILGEAKK